jgi:hypothetical protein
MPAESKIMPCPFCGNDKLTVTALEHGSMPYFIAVNCSVPHGCNSYGPSTLRTDLGCNHIWKKTGVNNAVRLWNRRAKIIEKNLQQRATAKGTQCRKKKRRGTAAI